MEALDAEPESDVKTEILCSLCIFSCVCVCALASGLTMGLVSLDETNLKIKAMVGTPEEKEAAEKLLPIIADHHLLLVSLLLCNCIAGEALPLFLDAVVSPILAVVLSVTFVLLFGEIIPSAIFTGPHQLIIASSCASTVNFILILFYPISKPIAMFLDYLFSDEHAKGVFIPRNELEALMILQTNKTSSSDGGEVSGGQQHFDGLNVEELRLVQGVLNLPKKCACDIMVPAKDLFMLSSHRVLDEV
jgi:CBS domain containing-hemolysin-like protein